MSRLVAFLFILSAAVSACRGPETPAPSPALEAGAFVRMLREAGHDPVEVGAVDQPFFQVPGVAVRIGEVDLQVFEYEDETGRQADSEQIAPDGSSIGATMVT